MAATFYPPASLPAYGVHRATHQRRAHRAMPLAAPVRWLPDRAHLLLRAQKLVTFAASRLLEHGALRVVHRLDRRMDLRSIFRERIATAQECRPRGNGSVLARYRATHRPDLRYRAPR